MQIHYSHVTRKSSGFTLLELLLGIAMSGILIGVIAQWFAVTIQARAKIDAIQQVDYYGERIMRDITQSIRNAKGISTPNQGATADSIVLSVDDTQKSPTTFDISSSVVRMDEGSNDPEALHPDWIVTSDFSVTNLSYPSTPGTLRVQFTLSRSNPSNSPSFNYQHTFYGSATLRQ